MLIQAGLGVGKGIYGASQTAKARKMGKGLKPPVNPTYDIPSAYKDYLANAQTAAGQTQLPGQRAMEQKLGAQTASGIRAMTEGADSSVGLMAGIGAMKGQQMQGQSDINTAGLSYQDQNKQRLQQALEMYGGQQGQQFQYNKIAPYESAMNQYNQKFNQSQALLGAGAQNIMGGFDTIGGAASGLVGSTNKQFRYDPYTGQRMADGGLVGKYKAAKRKGFNGSYTNWVSQVGNTFTPDFNLK